jgi:hypothetical protein
MIVLDVIGMIAATCVGVFAVIFTTVFAIDLAKLIDHRRWNSCRCPTCGNIKNPDLCNTSLRTSQSCNS